MVPSAPPKPRSQPSAPCDCWSCAAHRRISLCDGCRIPKRRPSRPGQGCPSRRHRYGSPRPVLPAGSSQSILAGRNDGAVKLKATQILKRILTLDEGLRGSVQPVVCAREKEAQRGCPRQQRQGPPLLRLQAADGLISLEQSLPLGHVEGMIALEAPGIERNRNVITQGIVAGEIKIDQTGKLIAQEKNVVGKKIGMDHAHGQAGGPIAGEVIEFLLDGGAQTRRNLIGMLLETGVERPPAWRSERI